MIYTKEFLEGMKGGMDTVKSLADDVWEAIEQRNYVEVSRNLLLLSGQAVNCQAVWLARLTYEKARQEQEHP